MLDALLEKYRDEGVLNLDDANALKVTPFTAMGGVVQLIKAFGGKEGFEKAVHELQDALYRETRVTKSPSPIKSPPTYPVAVRRENLGMRFWRRGSL